MNKPELKYPDIRCRVLWATAGLLELPFLRIIMGAPPSLPAWALIALHLAAAVCVYFSAGPKDGTQRRSLHWVESMALWTLVLPGLGWVIAAFLRFSCSVENLTHENLSPEELPEEEEDFVALAAAGAHTRGRLLEASDITPATDALIGADPTLKRGAVETLAKIRTPQAVAWLLKARADPNAEVRFYATSALTNLKHDYEQKLKAAEESLFQNPAQKAALLALNRTRLEFALSGLTEDRTRRDLLERSRQQLSKITASDIDVLRLLYEVERATSSSTALARLEVLLKLMPADRLHWLKEKAGLLFRMSRYDEVASLMAAIKNDVLEDASDDSDAREWKSAALWWAHD